jgi:hypothetical protein
MPPTYLNPLLSPNQENKNVPHSPIPTRDLSTRFILPDLRLNDITPHIQDFQSISMIQVIFQIEFIEVQGSEERCEMRWGVRSAEKGEGEIRAAGGIIE